MWTYHDAAAGTASLDDSRARDVASRTSCRPALCPCLCLCRDPDHASHPWHTVASFPGNGEPVYTHDCPACAGRFLCPCFDRGQASSGRLCPTSTGPASHAAGAPGRPPSHAGPRSGDSLVRDHRDGDGQAIPTTSSCPAGADGGTTLLAAAAVGTLHLGEKEGIPRCSCPLLDAVSVAGRADGTSAGLCLASHRVGRIGRATSDRRLHACRRWSVRVVELGSLVWEEDPA